MSGTMAVHDERLKGKIAAGTADNIYEVKATDSTTHVFQWIKHYANTQSGLDLLTFFCHGTNSQGSDGKWYPGYGLQIGSDEVTPNNVSDLFFILNGATPQIELKCCGAANINKINNGHWLCQTMARKANAVVSAARDEQIYTGNRWGSIDFGKWEGPTYSFFPDGTYNVLTGSSMTGSTG